MKFVVKKKSAVLIALTLAASSFAASGCRLFVYDDSCCLPPPPPPEPIYYAPAPPPQPVYYAPAEPEPGVYLYSPEPYYGPRPGLDVNIDVRGQAPSDDFPTVDASFPTVDAGNSILSRDSGANAVVPEREPVEDAEPEPPTSSELPEFTKTGLDVPEPSGVFEPLKESESFRPTPKRESLAQREAQEKKLEDAYDSWRKKQKEKRNFDSKTPRYLQPISDDGEELFARDEAASKAQDRSFIRRVTADSLVMMRDDEQYNRELDDWEKDVPTPIDWSKYNPLSLETVREWLGMGPDEKAALEYMRQACLKQKEYEKTKERKLLKEAAVLYEKAAKRWPGPALRPEDAKKNPFKAPKTGTLIEEDGLFFAGECWFFYHDFNNALACYKALVSTYNASIYKEIATKRLFYIGNYWVKLSEEESTPKVHTDRDKPRFGSFSGAVRAYEAIFLNDVSDNGMAPAALFALANAYMRRGVKQGDGSYENAAFYYRQRYENYPGNERAEKACWLAMVALHRSYLGPFYDSQPLDEARKLGEAIVKSGRGNVDMASKELDLIKDEQAKRLLVLGQYYERRGNYASARSFYNRLVKEHPNSAYATQGARAYGEIETKPAEVDQLAWIRPIAPFLPNFTNEYFEEAPDASMAEIARRDEKLDRLGKFEDENAVAEAENADAQATKTAAKPSERKIK